MSPAGWLLLQQQRGMLSYEQTRRYLQQWATFQVGQSCPAYSTHRLNGCLGCNL